MWAALRLRLLEARRRGGLWFLAAAFAVVLLVALFGGETVDGRYGLATDLAATLGYVTAIFFGAVPLAVDRERRRSYLPSASPVSPWAWALGNAAGAAVVAGVAAFLLFAAAGIGTAVRGGIDTNAVTPVGGRGTQWLPVDIGGVPADAGHVRLEIRSYLTAEDAVGTPDAATITVNGKPYEVFPHQTLVAPITPPRIQIRNTSPEFAVGIVRERISVLGAERSFLLNALGSGAAPGLGAAALAAFGAAAGANLSAAVAALLTALVLLLASMKGFLLESFEEQRETAREAFTRDRGHDHPDGHDQGPPPSRARAVARTLVTATLTVLPDLSRLDRTDRVALGEWTAAKRSDTAGLVLAAALAFAALLGGLGVHARRTP